MFSSPNTNPVSSTSVESKPLETDTDLAEIESKQKQLFSPFEGGTLPAVTKILYCPDDKLWESLMKAQGERWQKILLNGDEWRIKNAAHAYEDRVRYMHKSGHLLYCYLNTGKGGLDIEVFLIIPENGVAHLHKFFSLDVGSGILPNLEILPFNIDVREYSDHVLSKERIENWFHYAKQISRQFFAISMGRDFNAVQSLRNLVDALNNYIGDTALPQLDKRRIDANKSNADYFQGIRSDDNYFSEKSMNVRFIKELKEHYSFLKFDHAVLKKWLPLSEFKMTPEKRLIYPEIFESDDSGRERDLDSLNALFLKNLTPTTEFRVYKETWCVNSSDSASNKFGVIAYSLHSTDDRLYDHVNFAYFEEKEKEKIADFDKRLQNIQEKVIKFQNKMKGPLPKKKPSLQRILEEKPSTDHLFSSTSIVSKQMEFKSNPLESDLAELESKQQHLFASFEAATPPTKVKLFLCPDDTLWESLLNTQGQTWKKILSEDDEFMIQNASTRSEERSRYLYKSGNLLYHFQNRGQEVEANVFLVSAANGITNLHKFFSLEADRSVLPNLSILPFTSLDPYEFPQSIVSENDSKNKSQSKESQFSYAQQIARQLFAISIGKNLNTIPALKKFVAMINEDIKEKAVKRLNAERKNEIIKNKRYYTTHEVPESERVSEKSLNASYKKRMDAYGTTLQFDDAILEKNMPLPEVKLTAEKRVIYSNVFIGIKESDENDYSMVQSFLDNLDSVTDFHIDKQIWCDNFSNPATPGATTASKNTADIQKPTDEFGVIAYGYHRPGEKPYYHVNFNVYEQKDFMDSINRYFQELPDKLKQHQGKKRLEKSSAAESEPSKKLSR